MAITGMLDIQRSGNPSTDQENSFPQKNALPQRAPNPANRRPARQAPNFNPLRSAAMLRELESLQDQLKTDPRSVMIKVSRWIVHPTHGLPQAESRADAFLKNINEAKSLISDNKLEEAFKLFTKCHHDFDCAVYIGEFPVSRDKEQQAHRDRIMESMKVYAEVGRAFEKKLLAGVDKENPGTNLRILEQINTAEGKKVDAGLQDLYREIAVLHEPFLVGSDTTEDPKQVAKDKLIKESTQEYNAAVKLYNDKSFALAEAAFKAFQKKYPEHQYSKKVAEAIKSCVFQKISSDVQKLEDEITQRRADKPNGSLFELVSEQHDWSDKLNPVIKQLENLSKTDKNNAGRLLVRLAELQTKAGFTSESIELYSKAKELLSSPSEKAYAVYSIGVCQQKTYKPREAEATFAAFCKEHSSDKLLAEVELRRAHIAIAQSRFEDSRKHYAAALAAKPATALKEQTLVEAAGIELKHGDHDKAREYYKTLIAEFPKSKHAANAKLLIASSQSSDNFSKALELSKAPATYKEAIALFKEVAKSSAGTQIGEQASYRAIYYSAQSKNWADVQTLGATFKKDYKSSAYLDEVAELKAQSLQQEGKLQDSILAYNGLVKDFPKHERIEIWKKAISDLGNIERTKEYNSLVSLLQEKKAAQVPEKLAAFIERYPNDSRIDALRYNHASLLTENKEYAKAIEIFESLAQSKDKNIKLNSNVNAATLAYSNNDLEKATSLISAFEKSSASLKDAPGFSTAQSRMNKLELQLLSKQANTFDTNNDAKALRTTIESLQKKHPNAVETARALILEANNLLAEANKSLSKGDETQALSNYKQSASSFSSALEIFRGSTLSETTKSEQESISNLQSALNTNIDALQKNAQLATLRSANTETQTQKVIDTATAILSTKVSALVKDECSFRLAAAYKSSGDIDKAVEVLESVIKDSTSIYGPRARISLGDILLSKGKTKEAGVRFAEAAAIESKITYSQELQQDIGRCQIDGLIGLLKCYQSLGHTELVKNTNASLQAHKALTTEDKAAIATLLK